MGAKEKWQRELEAATARRKSEVIDAAKTVFFEKTIEKATIKDVAQEAEIGVASIYRYFSNKKDLVEIVANDYIDSYEAVVKVKKGALGVDQVEELMNKMIPTAGENIQRYIFIEQFENFVMNDPERNNCFDKIKKIEAKAIERAIEVGMNDGSIRENIEPQKMSQQIIDMLFILIQKLQISNKGNESGTDNGQVKLFKEMTIHYLQAME